MEEETKEEKLRMNKGLRIVGIAMIIFHVIFGIGFYLVDVYQLAILCVLMIFVGIFLIRMGKVDDESIEKK